MNKPPLDLLRFARGVGHTTLMMEGLKHFKGRVMLVAHTHAYAEQIRAEVEAVNPGIDILATNPVMHNLRGNRLPIAIDHHAIAMLFEDATRYIDEQERKVKSLEEREVSLRQRVSTLEYQLKEAQRITRAIEWEPITPGSFNAEFTGYTAAPYCTGNPELGWCLYSRGAGGCWNQRTKQQLAPSDELVPKQIDGKWYWMANQNG